MSNQDDVQRFSPHLAKLLVTKSPYHAWCDAYKLGNRPRKPTTDSQRKGKLIDLLVFGVGDTVRIRAPREKTTTAYGEIVCLQSEFDAAKECADSVKFWLKENGYDLKPENAQPKWRWMSGNGVSCGGRPDYFDPDTGLILDLKSTWAIGDRSLEYAFRDQWCFQAGAYIECADRMLGSYEVGSGGKVPPSPRMEFLVVESSEPYDVRLVTLSTAMVLHAKTAWSRACAQWKVCLETDQWPATGNLKLSGRGEGLGSFGADAFDNQNNNGAE